MSLQTLTLPKITKSSSYLVEKLLNVYHIKTDNKDTPVEQPNRKIGTTDYAKYEKMAKEIEREEILSQKDILNALNPNDFKKQKQLYEGATKPKIEACMIFKNEADFNLKQKKYAEAINSYEKSLLQLFINFNEDEEAKKQVEKLKCSINLNLSMALMNLAKYKEAIGYLKEAKRLEPKNLKTLYRMGYCYLKLNSLDEAKQIVDEGLAIDNNSNEFKQLKDDIFKKEKEDNMQRGKMSKKALKK